MPFILLLGVFLTGCVSLTGEDKAPESKLEYLNGDKYHLEGPTVLAGPVPLVANLHRVSAETEISGKVAYPGYESSSDEITRVSLRHVRFAKVSLQIDDKEKASALTDEKGYYRISAIIPNGSYRLVVEEQHFKGARDIEVRSHEVKGADITVRSRSKPKKTVD